MASPWCSPASGISATEPEETLPANRLGGGYSGLYGAFAWAERRLYLFPPHLAPFQVIELRSRHGDSEHVDRGTGREVGRDEETQKPCGRFVNAMFAGCPSVACERMNAEHARRSWLNPSVARALRYSAPVMGAPLS